MMILFYLLFVVVMVPLIQCDRIIVNEPIKGGRFKPGSIMDIDYTVRFEGMAKLGSASVSILYPNHTIITFLPEGNWMDSADGRRGASASWAIPSDLDAGEYRLRISGPAVYLCSEQGNGQAPYSRCQMSIHRTRTFIVDEDGENGTDPEADNNQDDQGNQDDGITNTDQPDTNIDMNQDNANIDINQEGQDTTNADSGDQDTDVVEVADAN